MLSMGRVGQEWGLQAYEVTYTKCLDTFQSTCMIILLCNFQLLIGCAIFSVVSFRRGVHKNIKGEFPKVKSESDIELINIHDIHTSIQIAS